MIFFETELVCKGVNGIAILSLKGCGILVVDIEELLLLLSLITILLLIYWFWSAAFMVIGVTKQDEEGMKLCLFTFLGVTIIGVLGGDNPLKRAFLNEGGDNLLLLK